MASNMSIGDFNNNFVTQIKTIETSHTDETGTYDFGVGFNVVCVPNNRLMYFENHLNSNVLPSNFETNDVITTAWSNLIPDVKTWAATVISSQSLLGSPFTPDSNLDFTTTSNFPLSEYTSNFSTTISRFEVYPPLNPKTWCVGFNVTRNDSTQNMYIDTSVAVNTFAIPRPEMEIVNMGWSNVKEAIGIWAKDIHATSALVNSTFTPSTW